MKRLLLALVVVLVSVVTLSSVAVAQSTPQFKLGFKALADQVPAVVGTPRENEHWGANGDSIQLTTNGMMAWRKADNWTAFTDGATTWINGPIGIQSRSNNQRFSWEADAGRYPNVGAPAPAPAPPAPAPSGYRYIDPRAIRSDTSTYVGQKVALMGGVTNVHHYNTPQSFSWVQLSAWVEGTNPAKWQDLVVRFYPKQGAILQGDTIKVYGTVTGTETTVFVQSGVPTTDAVIMGDRWEPW